MVRIVKGNHNARPRDRERDSSHAIGSVVVATRYNWGAADVRVSLKYKLTENVFEI